MNISKIGFQPIFGSKELPSSGFGERKEYDGPNKTNCDAYVPDFAKIEKEKLVSLVGDDIISTIKDMSNADLMEVAASAARSYAPSSSNPEDQLNPLSLYLRLENLRAADRPWNDIGDKQSYYDTMSAITTGNNKLDLNA